MDDTPKDESNMCTYFVVFIIMHQDCESSLTRCYSFTLDVVLQSHSAASKFVQYLFVDEVSRAASGTVVAPVINHASGDHFHTALHITVR